MTATTFQTKGGQSALFKSSIMSKSVVLFVTSKCAAVKFQARRMASSHVVSKRALCKGLAMVAILVVLTMLHSARWRRRSNLSIATIPPRKMMLKKRAIVAPSLKKRATVAPIPSTTGSFVNCTKTQIQDPLPEEQYDDSIVISCHSYFYKLHVNALWRISDNDWKQPAIIYVVISTSKARRDGIRQTWKQLKSEHVIFVVSGRFADVRDEYDRYNDIVWIHTPNAASDTTIKLLFSYYVLLHHISGFRVGITIFDDTFVNITKFENGLNLFKRNTGEADYLDENMHLWGRCTRETTPSSKLSIPNYPFENIPPYCKGGIFWVSKVFLSCAVQELATLWPVNQMDVATAMLAERCHVIPDIAHEKIILLPGEVPKQQPSDYWIARGFMNIKSMVQRWNGSDLGSSNPYFLEGAATMA